MTARHISLRVPHPGKIGDVSLEFCGGPHVNRTSEIGRFQIKKEQSSSAGVRRIRAQIS